MRIYKLKRRSDGKFFSGSHGSKSIDGHDFNGRIYSSELSAVRALESSGREIAYYDCIVYECSEIQVINYREVLQEA
jgi:hypothetical protein